jgi:hypothetical protein
LGIDVAVILAGLALTQGALGGPSGRSAGSSAQADDAKQQTAATTSGAPQQAATSGASGAVPKDPAAQPRGEAASNELAVGTAICAVLTQTVDAKKAKAGEAVSARTTLAVLSHGRVLIANGAKISGRVTKAKARSGGNPESELRVVFDRATLKDGSEMRLALTVQAIGYGGLPQSTSTDPEASNPFGPISNPQLSGTGTTPMRHSGVPQPQPLPRPQPMETPDLDRAGTSGGNPVLDVGSKGAVGLPGLVLTEGLDTNQGSAVKSTIKNVRLENGSQLILRVIADKAEGASQKAELKRQ